MVCCMACCSTAPSLSNKKYSTFARTVSSYISQGPALASTMRQLKWQHCAMLTSTSELYFQTSASWSQHFWKESIEVMLQSFKAGLFQQQALDEVRKSGLRVVVVLADRRDTGNIAVTAAKLEMTRAGWGWLAADNVQGAEKDSEAEPKSADHAKLALHGWCPAPPAPSALSALPVLPTCPPCQPCQAVSPCPCPRASTSSRVHAIEPFPLLD